MGFGMLSVASWALKAWWMERVLVLVVVLKKRKIKMMLTPTTRAARMPLHVRVLRALQKEVVVRKDHRKMQSPPPILLVLVLLRKK
jgi:hypothetical protein